MVPAMEMTRFFCFGYLLEQMCLLEKHISHIEFPLDRFTTAGTVSVFIFFLQAKFKLLPAVHRFISKSIEGMDC